MRGGEAVAQAGACRCLLARSALWAEDAIRCEAPRPNRDRSRVLRLDTSPIIGMQAETAMAKEIVETFYGKRSKFTVVKHKNFGGGVEFTVEKDESRFRGTFSSLQAAVNAAQEEAKKQN